VTRGGHRADAAVTGGQAAPIRQVLIARPR
jgi:hypothetical protein